MNHIKNIYALKNNFVLNMYIYIYICLMLHKLKHEIMFSIGERAGASGN